MSWLDRNRCFFVTTMWGIREGEKISCKRLRQLDKSGQVPLDKVILEVAQLKAIAKHYEGAGSIDQHKRIHANKLQVADGPQSHHQTLGQEVQPRSPQHHLH
jgi:hypothetical protein